MKDYERNKKPHLKYWDANNLYDWAMSKIFPENDFKWVDKKFMIVYKKL